MVELNSAVSSTDQSNLKKHLPNEDQHVGLGKLTKKSVGIGQ